jgi:putative transposase
MDAHRDRYTAQNMCEALQISRSGYYAWRSRQPSRRQQEDEALLGRIRAVHAQSRRLYGSPRITAVLREQGLRCGKHRIARIMKASSIRGEVKKRRFRRTTESRHQYALAADLLMARGQTEGVWVSDITFVPTSEGWLYVAIVMDLHSRKILGLSMRETLSQELASAALRDAVGRQRPSAGLIHHSDRGRQYASYAYQALLKAHQIRPSMGRSGNCYDNAYAESFFGTLKTELVHGERYRTRQDARLSIFEYVEVFYNRQRRHSALGYRSPEQYDQLGREI